MLWENYPSSRLLRKKGLFASAQVGQATFPDLPQAASSHAAVAGWHRGRCHLREPESRVQGQMPCSSRVARRERLDLVTCKTRMKILLMRS